MKSLFSAISPNRESNERAEGQIREEGEIVIIPASGNLFGSERFDGQPDAGDPVSPNAPTLHASSSPPALRIAVSAPRSIAFMRQTLEQLLGPSCAQYLADLHATDRQSHLIHYVWTHESGPLSGRRLLPRILLSAKSGRAHCSRRARPIGGAQSASASHKGRFGPRQMALRKLAAARPWGAVPSPLQPLSGS